MDLETQDVTVHAIGEAAELGVWTITVAEVIAGDEAASLMAETNSGNPEAPEGLTWLCAKISATNTSEMNRSIQMVDFGASGGDGVIRRTWAVAVPDPMLQAVVKPGESTEGWIAVWVADPASAILIYDSPILGGNWSTAVFALADGATWPDSGELDAASTDVGSDLAAPVSFGETVTVGGWEITVSNPAMGTEHIWGLFDSQAQALGKPDAEHPNLWFDNGAAIHVAVRNLNPFPSFFSEIALEVCDWNGEPWDHMLGFTVPDAVDVSREYLPGAGSEGIVAFAGQEWTQYNLLKVSPNRLTGEARYYTFGGDPDAAPATSESTPEETTSEPVEVAVGDVIETIEDLVNLRKEPKTGDNVIEELPLGTKMEVTAEPEEADGKTWIPVTVIDGGQSGYVVSDYVKLSDS